MLWDLPIRVFHWGVVLCVVGAIVSANMLEFAIHARFGVSLLGLLLFRLLWGFWGSEAALFRSFLVAPQKLWAYLQAFRASIGSRKHKDYRTHNPLGGWAVAILLALMFLQIGTGTFANNDVLFEGPLAQFAPQWSDIATQWHHIVGPTLAGFILIHLLAVLWHRFYWKEPLLKRIIVGEADTAPTRSPAMGLGLMALCQLPTHSLLLLL